MARSIEFSARVPVPRKLAQCCALAMGFLASSTCLADEIPTIHMADTGSASLTPIHIDEMVNNGRPENFYSLKFSADAKVCDVMADAMRRKHKVTGGRYKDPIRDLLLGSEYSIKWYDLKDDLDHPVARADIDLNNDGHTETVYRLVSVLGGPYLYGLAVTHGHSADETVLSRERKAEILGGPLEDRKWGGVPRNSLFITAPRYIDGTSDTVETIVPALPAGIALPLPRILDVVLVEDRYYVVLGPAYHLKDPPIKLYVFQTRTPRDHSLICYFESNFLLRKP